MNTAQAIVELRSGRTLLLEVRPDGTFGFSVPSSDAVERVTVHHGDGGPVTAVSMHPVLQQSRILPRKPADRDPTAWLRDRFGRLRR